MSGLSPATALSCVLAVLLVWAGVQDARTREIANWKNAAIALLAPVWWWANGLALWPDIAIQLGIALLVFAAFVTAFHFGWMGGGDVKMIGALALWLPLQPLAWMLIVMSLIGGALTVVLMLDRAVRARTAHVTGQVTGHVTGQVTGQIEVPYGVAIAIAALFALHEPLFNHFGVNA